MRHLLLLLLLVAACGRDRSTDCPSLRDPVERENCYFENASKAFNAADPTGGPTFVEALARIEPAASRDLVRLRIAIDRPAQAGALCRQVETPGARDKCRQVLGRPHLGATPHPPEPPATEAPPSAPPEPTP